MTHVSPSLGFREPRLLLPRPGIDLRKWAVIACDQHTAEPAYWQRVADEVGQAPSTLHLIYPEAFLGEADSASRIAGIQRSMQRCLDEGLFVEHVGPVLVERRTAGQPAYPGATRRGLMLELDLECYDFRPESTSLIRPTEGTIVSRLAPRIAVRSGATLELPHVLVLIDDRERTVIEPLVAERAALRPLYDTELMLGGGHVAGHAVDSSHAQRAMQALRDLGDPAACARRYGLPEGTPPMLFAVGDGNHSLATAKALWQRIKADAGPDHPARWALVEVENIDDPALKFEPIHRMLLGVTGDLRGAIQEAFRGCGAAIVDCGSSARMRERLAEGAASPASPTATPSPGGSGALRQAFGLIGPGAHFAVVELAQPPEPLAVASVQAFVDRLVEQGGAADVDYVHGDDVLERLAQQPGHVGLHIGTVGKSELLERVMRGGPLPRKTFSMGEADEKRFYVEARRIR
ncbi:MAG: DUF1015 domain-containing protein [Rubrivivax sp.]|nr:DUF1015 domain-containing protein [Rubrivivax sp.]